VNVGLVGRGFFCSLADYFSHDEVLVFAVVVGLDCVDESASDLYE